MGNQRFYVGFFSKKRICPLHSEIVKNFDSFLNWCFPRTPGSISTKLGTVKTSLGLGNADERPRSFPESINSEIVKIHN